MPKMNYDRCNTDRTVFSLASFEVSNSFGFTQRNSRISAFLN